LPVDLFDHFDGSGAIKAHHVFGVLGGHLAQVAIELNFLDGSNQNLLFIEKLAQARG
jgi:hypothetical protein